MSRQGRHSYCLRPTWYIPTDWGPLPRKITIVRHKSLPYYRIASNDSTKRPLDFLAPQALLLVVGKYTMSSFATRENIISPDIRLDRACGAEKVQRPFGAIV